MLKPRLLLCALLSVAATAQAQGNKNVTWPYKDVAIVTNTISWPYDTKDPSFGNNSFQLGGDDNTDTQILKSAMAHGLSFPADFAFGVACSAYQYEGNRIEPVGNSAGTGWSMWDVFSKKDSWLNPKRENGHYNIAEVPPTSRETDPNGSKAIEGFYKYRDDIRKVSELGATTYRLSISWPRLFPRAGMDKPDPAGIAYYVDVLKAVNDAKLTPLVTLYHWDMPAWLYNFGDPNAKNKTYGWLDMNDAHNNLTLLEFQKYAAAVYTHLGKYTSHFSTFNEPLTFTNNAFVIGNHAPGKNGFPELWKWEKQPGLYGTDMTTSIERIPYLQAINIIKAHDIAYKTIHAMYKEKGQELGLKEPKVSIVLNSDWAEPFRINCDDAGHNCSYEQKDIEASERQMDYMLGWWLHPVMFGSWPASMNKVYGDKNRIKVGLFDDKSCLRADGVPVVCDDKTNTLTLSADIKRGGTLDELAINHYTGYFVVDMDYARKHFGDDPSKGSVPYNQYGGTPTNLGPGWDSDQNAFTTQFRYFKYGEKGPAPAVASNIAGAKRAYVIGSAGAQPWLRQTWFVYRKLMQYINSYYLHNADAHLPKTTKSSIAFTKLNIFLTENGTSIVGESQKEGSKDQTNDLNRVQYLVGNLGALHHAKKDDGINIKLYTYWSIADNFEWGEGYDSRFGILWIDYASPDLTRMEKQSYKCYRKIIENNRDGNSQFPGEECPVVLK